jgi:hypothetical protein
MPMIGREHMGLMSHSGSLAMIGKHEFVYELITSDVEQTDRDDVEAAISVLQWSV